MVDSTDPDRLSEAKDALREFLRSEKVRGKPVLLLCNKTDVETAEEMDVVVDALNVERLVNEAREGIQNKIENVRLALTMTLSYDICKFVLVWSKVA